MLIKVTLLFLLGMILIGMIGRALFPGTLRRVASRRMLSAKPSTCVQCGRYVIGTGPCDCTAPKRKV